MNLLDLYAKVSIDTSDYEEGLRSAGDAADDMGSRSEGAGGKVQNLGPITVAAGKLIADGFEKAIGAVKEFAQYAVDSSLEYEDAFAKVTTIMDDTQVSTDDMSSAIKDLSSEMGISASDISNSVYDVISATGDTANAVSLVETATKLAKGGFADTADATSVLTTAINAYGLSMEDAESVSDSLITVQNLGVTTVGELSTQMGKAIATGASYGVDLNNLEAGYIALTKAGIGTAESTTYMSSMINELGDAGSDVSGILQEKTGQSFGELMNSGKDLADVLDILYDSCDYDSEAFANLWGSAEAGKAASAIAGQGFDSWEDSMNALADSAGSTQTAYETMSSTTSDKISQMKTSFENLSTEAMEPIMEKVNEFIPKITEMIDSIDIDAVYSTLQQIAPILGAIGVAIGVVTAGITAYNVVAAIKAAMDAAEVTTLGALVAGELASAAATAAAVAPFILVAAAIAAVIAIGVLVVKNWDTIKEKASEIAEKVSEAFKNLKQKVSDAISNLKQAVVDKFNEIKQKITDTVNNIKQAVSDKFNSIKSDVSDKVEGIKSSVTEKFNSIKSKITDTIEGARDKVKAAVDKIKGFFNFSWSLPSLKLPHFSVSGKFSLNPLSVPSFSISWYKKAMDSGLMFNEPTVLATAAGMKGFGDAGSEIVIGKDSLMNMVSEATASDIGTLARSLDNCYELLSRYIPEMAGAKTVVLDDGTVAGKLTNGVNRNMRMTQLMESRGVA